MRRTIRRVARAAISCALSALLLLAAAGCGRPHFDPYAANEGLLSIATEYQIVRGVDIYRQEIPRDVTGQNLARATLVRLANYERLPQHVGRFAPEVAWLKGQAFADLGDYGAARREFSLCADFDTELRPKALDAATLAGEFDHLVGKFSPDLTSLEAYLASRATQRDSLVVLRDRAKGSRWETLAEVEIENADIARAEFLDANRQSLADGEKRAQQAFENLLKTHRESRRALSHALRLAEFHLAAARRIVQLRDPERGDFEFAPFAAHLEPALDLLHRVSQADGHEEKPIAQHQLDAALAWYEEIRRLSR